ncbi:hypothetical protein MNEG_0025 [Monoraphidium neglectum]|uniref:Uncharacterized protein n=1 Tax=Monoraphidium neglectum TaxID=145388 RepID=A0A0D2KCU5_9CHLO|nr:hypothetical protein MNEG_0025 [Monoraphidium neglectum]KIZ07908.1 hypothetical protein MNEG_0025 [Monoraphidium neglectum]|eukprot:XP_013906927.1 hypothetical protein MNEG_0025 [Monoraphidium neglectum]
MDAAVSAAAALLLEQECAGDACDVAHASIVVGVLQDALISGQAVDVQAEAAAYQARFLSDLVAPCLTKTTKAKSLEQKLVALSKHLWTRLSKAATHKQPQHAQFLVSALRPSGARRLDCLGLAAAALALCRALAAAEPGRHADLAAAEMLVSDDHCWLRIPPHPDCATAPAAAAPAPAHPALCAADEGPAPSPPPPLLPGLHFEVTDCRALKADQMEGRWLYGGGGGAARVAPRHMAALLAAAMTPEELREKDPAAAARVRAGQKALLAALAEGRAAAQQGGGAGEDGNGCCSIAGGGGMGSAAPEGGDGVVSLAEDGQDDVLYSVLMRWGLLFEEDEVEELEAAADDLDLPRVRALLLGRPHRSQRLYARSLAASSGWQLHPASAAVWGWLNLANAAFCGTEEEPVSLREARQQGQRQQARLAADSGPVDNPGTSNSGAAAVEAASGQSQAVAPAQQAAEAAGPSIAGKEGVSSAAGQALTWGGLAIEHMSRVGGALAPVTAVLRRYAGRADVKRDEALLKDIRELLENLSDAFQGTAELLQAERGGGSGAGGAGGGGASDNGQLQGPLEQLLLFMDGVCAYHGDDGDLQQAAVDHFVTAAASVGSSTRAAALRAAAPQLASERWRRMADGGFWDAWEALGPGLRQAIQLPCGRAPKRPRLRE